MKIFIKLHKYEIIKYRSLYMYAWEASFIWKLNLKKKKFNLIKVKILNQAKNFFNVKRTFSFLFIGSVLLELKGTVSVISCDPPCKDEKARFLTVSLKALSDQV